MNIPVINIESIDKNKLVLGLEIVHRNTIMLVVKHPFDNKYLYLHNKNFGWNVLVQGGIEKGESTEEAVVRELKEETGYFNIKKLEKLPIVFQSMFFAPHKKENRSAIINPYYVELDNLKQENHEDDAEVLFESYENLYEIFGPEFRHHYFLLNVALGKEDLSKIFDKIAENKLGSVEFINHKVSRA